MGVVWFPDQSHLPKVYLSYLDRPVNADRSIFDWFLFEITPFDC